MVGRSSAKPSWVHEEVHRPSVLATPPTGGRRMLPFLYLLLLLRREGQGTWEGGVEGGGGERERERERERD